MYTQQKIGFLGLGKMGAAIATGLLARHPEIRLAGYDVQPPDANAFAPLKRMELHDSARALEAVCDIILLCVKPVDMATLIGNLKGDKKYISIAAGVEINTIKSMFGPNRTVQIARVMPNISALIGESVSGVYSDQSELLELTAAIFNDIGYAIEVSREELLHAVTGLSGSGPAFVFAVIQGLAEGGVLSGLSYDTALRLAAHTLRGAAGMVLTTGEHPDVLRNKVTSPGGTTIAGLKELEDNGVHGALMAAVQAAVERSRELGGPQTRT